MTKYITQLLFIALMLALAGCGEESEDGSLSAELDVYGSLECEEGYIPWRFPERGVSTDSEEYASTSEGSGELDPLTIYDSVRVKVETVEYLRESNIGYDLTWTKERAELLCNNSASCRVPNVVCRNKKDGNCKYEALKITYSCSGLGGEGDSTLYTAEYASSGTALGSYVASCEQPARERIESISRVACVPAVCHGRSRRNADMECVVDPELEEVVVDAEIVSAGPVYRVYDAFSYHDNIVPLLQDGTLPQSPVPIDGLFEVDVKVTFANGIVPDEVKFAAWLEEEITIRDARNVNLEAGSKVRGYRCNPFGFTIREEDPHTVGPNGEWIFERSIRVNFSQECNAPGSYDLFLEGLGKRTGNSPSALHQARNLSQGGAFNRAYLHLSYDMLGDSVWHKSLKVTDPVEKLADSEPECSPNPSTFFYDAEKRYYRMDEYYNQRKIASAKRPIIFSDQYANRAELGPIDLTPRSELLLRPSSKFIAPLKVDLTWYANNFTLSNFFSPDAEDLGWTSVENLRADFYVLPMNLTDEERKSTEPLKIGTLPLKVPRSKTKTSLGDPLMKSQTGIVESASIPITSAVRDSFTKATSATSFSFIADDVAMFDLFYCINADLKNFEGDPTLFRPLLTDKDPIYGRQALRRQDGWWLTKLTEARRGMFSGERISYTRAVELERPSVPAYAPSTNGSPWKMRGCATAKVPLTVYVDRFASPLEPVSGAGVSGQADEKKSGDPEMAGSGDNDYAETCEDNSTSSIYCTTTSRSDSRSEGEGGNSIFDLVTRIQNDDDIEGDTAPRSTVTVGAEMLGLYTLDQNSLLGEWADGSVPGSSQSLKFTMSPDWDAIYNAVKGIEPGPAAEWTKGYESGRDGLGIAWKYKFLIKVGPVPVFITFALTVGGSVSLDVQVDFTPQDEDDAYGCLGEESACVELVTEPKTFADAAQHCYEEGGRLAEFSSAAEADDIVAAMFEEDVTEAWIGAQLAYKHEGESCILEAGSGWLPLDFRRRCSSSGQTEYRWLSNSQAFARNPAGGATEYITGAPLFYSKKEGLSTTYPAYGAVYYKRGTNSLGTAQLDGRDVSSTNPVEPKKAFACALDPADSETYLKWSIGTNFGLAAGFSLTGCTPTPDNGFCLAAEFNIAKMEIVPNYSQTFRWLFNSGESEPFGRRGMQSFSIPLSLNLFSGEVKAFVQFLWFTVEWVIKGFDGIQVLDENLYELNLPMKEVY